MAIILCPGCGDTNIDTKVEKVCKTCVENGIELPEYKVEEIEMPSKRKFNLITFNLG